MKHTGKRVLSMLCALTMLLSLMAMIAPGAFAETTTTNEIDAIPSGHLAAVRYYSDFSTEAGKTAYVDDADAYGGKAVCYSKANFDGGDYIGIHRYESATGVDASIAQMFKEDLNFNQGYHVYKFTYDVPANATENGVVYIMPNWQLNSSQLCKDIYAYAGQTVELYFSMKVTGPDADGLYSVYVDRVALATVCDYKETGICTECGKQDALLAGIPSEHLKSVRIYSYFATEAGKTAYVDDAEAYEGKAVCYSKANFDGGDYIGIHRYESATGVDASIAQMFKEDLNVNQGYHVYKFTYDVPANATENGVVYIMPNWQLNSSQLCKDIYAYAGQTVELYFSMKVTGPDADGLYSVYVDRVALATVCDYNEAGICTECGKALSITFLADDITLAMSTYDTKVADPDSAYGKAAKLSAEARAGDGWLYGMMFYSGGKTLPFWVTDNTVHNQAGAITDVQFQANAAAGKYVTYKFSKLDLSGMAFMYTFDWTVRTNFTAEQMSQMQGKLMDMTVSMKVTGDVTGADASNLPTYYIDCISYTVSQPDLIDQIPSEHVASVRDYSKFNNAPAENTNHVSDIEAYNGMAVCHTTDNPKMTIYRYDVASGLGDGAPALNIGNLTEEDLKINQGYQVYKFTYDVPAETTAGNTFYIMPNWQLNNADFCADFAPYAGKTVDVYLSIKVTGPTADGYYSIYVDRVALATACEWDDGVVTTEPTTTTEGVKTYTCSVCNNTKTESVEKLTVPAASWNLVLDGNIGMNFHLNVTAEQIDTATVDVTINGVTTTTNVNTLPKDENNLPILSVELAAAQMTEPVAVVVRAGDVELVKNYTVREYADYILDEANGYGEEVKALVKNMLNYGAASQNYFDYNSGLLANDGLDITAATVLTEGGEVAVTGSVSGLAFYGATLVHKNKIAVRFYFTGSIEGIETDYAVKEKNGMYYIEVADIVPQDLDQDITISVSDGTNTLSISYAPMDYIIRMYNKESSSENTKALVQALYGYYLAAEAYVAA